VRRNGAILKSQLPSTLLGQKLGTKAAARAVTDARDAALAFDAASVNRHPRKHAPIR